MRVIYILEFSALGYGSDLILELVSYSICRAVVYVADIVLVTSAYIV